MSEKVALVTGGIGELGRSICERLTQQGCRVAALDIALTTNGEDGRSWQARLAREGRDIVLIAGDVTDFDSCTQAVAHARCELGPVYILVNCAGITRDASLRKLGKGEWDAVLATNLDSVFNVTKQVIDGMTQRGFGRIVNISSLNGVKGQFGQTNYSAAKAGMHGFTMALAQEVARNGVTVNTVSPGYMNTKMVEAVPREILDRIVAEIPVGRLGDTREIAALVGFLCSDDAAFITGANYSINGGHHMH
jgi:acetoacetyl-CoA reductase